MVPVFSERDGGLRRDLRGGGGGERAEFGGALCGDGAGSDRDPWGWQYDGVSRERVTYVTNCCSLLRDARDGLSRRVKGEREREIGTLPIVSSHLIVRAICHRLSSLLLTLIVRSANSDRRIFGDCEIRFLTKESRVVRFIYFGARDFFFSSIRLRREERKNGAL